MKIYSTRYSYSKEDFAENVKFSCHSWLLSCIEDINNTEMYVNKNKYFINEKDLVGKYNALNFLLEIYTYHQTSKFLYYPKDRNYILDFSIILNSLIKNNADLYSIDYERKSFLENLNNVFSSQENLSWKKDYSFISENCFKLLSDKTSYQTLKSMLENEKRPIYLGLCLDYSLGNENKQKLRVKL